MILYLFLSPDSSAQVPVISYTTPKIYTSGKEILPLVPAQAGGIVPGNSYHIVSTTAGNGGQYSQDGVGTASAFNMPSGIAADQSGNIYVSDYGSGAIRKISPGGVVSTIGNVSVPAGITVDQQGNIFVTSFQEDRIYKISAQGDKSIFAGRGVSGSADGQGTSATFYNLGGIVIDLAGNLFVAEQGNHKIRKISPTGLVSTVAGTGASGSADGPAASATFNAPDGLAVDPQGNIYVADTKNNKIRKISTNGMVTTLGGSGAIFNYPTGLVMDASGNLYVGDFRNNLIREITSDGKVSTLAGNGQIGNMNGAVSSSNFNGPLMLCIDSDGNLKLTDFLNNLIRKITLTGYTIDKVLPDGLSFDSETGTISGTPMSPSPATDYNITAYNRNGSGSTIVNITVIQASTISFPALPARKLCDPDFDPGALSTVPITYTSSNPAVATIVGGKIHIVGAGTTTITATNGISRENQDLTVDGLAVPQVRITPGIYSACDGMELTYDAISVNAGEHPTYQWYVNGLEVVADGSAFTSNKLVTGDQITCIVINNDACIPIASLPSAPASLVSTPYITLSLKISMSPTGEACEGSSITFEATPSDNLQDGPTYSWLVNGQYTGETGRHFTSSNLRDGDRVTCLMRSMGACIVNPLVTSDALTVHILPKEMCVVKIPNSFSPNGDGVNDVWRIEGLAVYPDCSVKIFSRNGVIVYQSVGYSYPWDGTSNGKQLPVGAYYYIILRGKEKERLAGSIMLLR